MVRSKVKPTRSIKDFDYGDQSVAFWFFSTGQPVPVPLRYKLNPTFYVPPIPPASNSNSNGQAHNQQRNSNYSFNQDLNHLNSGKDKRNDKSKKFTKVIKGEDSSNADVNFSNDEYSDSVSTKSGNSIEAIKREKEMNSNAFNANSNTSTVVHPLSSYPEISPLTDIQLMITEAIMAEGGGAPGVSISFDKIYEYVSKRWKNVKRRDGSNYNTDCRRAIQANLRHNPHHLPLFKKDKLKLSQNNWMLIFTLQDAIDTSKEAFEGTGTTASSKTTKRRDTNANSSGGKGVNNNNNEDVQNESEEEDEDEDDDDDYQVNNQSNLGGNSASNPPNSNSSTSTSSRSDSSSDKKLSDLQVLICECINDNGGSCHFDLIVHHVSKNWNKIKPTLNVNSNTVDPRSATLAALTDTSKRIFKRDTKKTGWWMINQSELSAYINSPSISAALHLDSNPLRATPRSKSRKSRANSDVHSPETIGSPDNSLSALDIISDQATAASSIVIDSKDSITTLNTPSTPISTPSTPSTPSDTSQLKKDKDAPSDLQVLIIKAIHNSPNGWATFDQINEQVSKLFDTVKRRDGAPYASDCKKAIQATLSNNPSARPFFKKEVKRGVTLWGLAKRSTDFLSEEKKKPPTAPATPSTPSTPLPNPVLLSPSSSNSSSSVNVNPMTSTPVSGSLENDPPASLEEEEEEIKDDDEANADESPRHSDKEKDSKASINKSKKLSSPSSSNLEGKRRRDELESTSNAEGNTSDSLSSPSKNDRSRKRRK